MNSGIRYGAMVAVLVLGVGFLGYVLSTTALHNAALAAGGAVSGGRGSDNPSGAGWTDSVCSQITNSDTETLVIPFSPPMTSTEACAQAMQAQMPTLIDLAETHCTNDLPASSITCDATCRKVWNHTEVLQTNCFESSTSVRLAVTVLCADQCKRFTKLPPPPRPL